MNHLKTFALFESKTHNLELPKDQSELDTLSESPGFSILKNFRRDLITGGGCKLVLMRNGGVEIIAPLNYNFRISPSGTFYYGGIKVGPKYNTNLDTWDKLFDYVYLYFLGTGLSVASSDTLENFVFHGVINSSLYSRIRSSKYYESILDMSRKYLGVSADEAVDKAADESLTYITDPLKLLETPSYKFFNKVFDFDPEFGKSIVKIKMNNKTPFGLLKNLDLKLPNYLGANIVVNFPGSTVSSSQQVRVKSMKGLDKNFLKQITNQYEKSLDQIENSRYSSYINRADDLSINLSYVLLKLFSRCIDVYNEGKDITDVENERKNITDVEIIDTIRDVFYNWKKSNESYIGSLVAIINTGEFNSVAKEISYSQKTIDIINSLKSEGDTIKYSKIMKEIGNVEFIKDAISDIYSKDKNIIKGGSMMRRFGFGDKN